MHRFDIALALGAVALTSAIFLGGCNTDDVKVGSSDQKLQDPKGGVSDEPVCAWDLPTTDPAGGEIPPDLGGPYKLGESFPSLDGCNTCTCTKDGIVCTEMACAPAPSNRSCEYHGHTFEDGGSVPSLDNCNSWGCADGALFSTQIACAYTCPDVKFVDCEPVVKLESLALCYGAYSDWIGQNCPDVVFAH